MTIDVTIAEVRENCPDLTLADSAINILIQAIGCRLDSCLETSYAECPDQAKLIKILTICHFGSVQSRAGQVTSRTRPNGASESYGLYVSGGQGLGQTNFGQSILLLDTAGCVNQTFDNSARQFITTAGTSGSRRTPYFSGEGLDS